MKFILPLIFVFSQIINAQNIKPNMEKSIVTTKLGAIAVFTKKVSSLNTPVIFLHGVYFDHNLWQEQINEINDRTVIAIDMPWHGDSKNNIKQTWNMNGCGDMLLDILDSLKINKVIAIGHSWGSMTILQASNTRPEKFVAIGLCNMPFEKTSLGKKISFSMQHLALSFREFYTKQAAKSLFGKVSLKANPAFINVLRASMSKLTIKQIKKTDKYVIINAENTSGLIEQLTVPAMALKGTEDYVPIPPKIETIIVKGGHISPLEAIEEVNDFCKKVIFMAEK